MQYKDSDPRYGFSFFIVWFVLIVYFASASLFILYSWRRGPPEPPPLPPKLDNCTDCAQAEDGEPLNRTCVA